MPRGGGGGKTWRLALLAAAEVLEIGNFGPVRARDANNSADALQTLLAAVQARATTLRAEANSLSSISAQSAVVSVDVAIQVAELATLQQHLASGVNASAQAASRLHEIIAAINAGNASLRPCETPAGDRAASPSRVYRDCH